MNRTLDNAAPGTLIPANLTQPIASTEPIMLGRLALLPDVSGALFLPEERTLIVADLHLEKGSAYAARGVALPPYDTRTTLARLADTIMRLAPLRVIALGDSWHDLGGYRRLDASDRDTLDAMVRQNDWLWITGNHDPQPLDAGGDTNSQVEIAGVRFVHEPTLEAGHEIAGHLHPCATLTIRGRRLRRRCFISSNTRLIMPAMGAYAGGLNVQDAAFAPLFPTTFKAHLLGDSRVFTVSHGMLRKS
jgi:uncharacterized protein